MKHHCDYIPLSLAEKLKEKGMLSLLLVGAVLPTYAEVFDWLMEKDIRIYPVKIKGSSLWHIIINDTLLKTLYGTWHEAAEAAIEKALTLI